MIRTSFDEQTMPKVFMLYLELSQYPVLGKVIRQRMREELFSRGVIRPQDFEQEVYDKAIESQEREGLTDPFKEEPVDVWQDRTEQVRNLLTDFYFAYNLPHDLLERIVREIVSQRAPDREVLLSFNPELAPWDLLFAQGEAYESQPPEKWGNVQHHLREIIVVLLKAMISDQLAFVRVAREYLSIRDLKAIRANRIGRGKIGGKAAGMLLAYKVLQREAAARGIDVDRFISIPESFYLGSDVFYEFHTSNDLFRFMNQKYKRPEEMVADYPQIYDAYLESQLPEHIQGELAYLLEKVGKAPLIVRSSSLLEDNFDTSFAGKYDSFFLPNQGTPENNLKELIQAVIKVYASVVRPEALIYRDHMGLTDYDERMGVLIQKVEGRRTGRYFFPALAGVGFSHNPYRWSKRIRSEEGLLRMVAGLGTRAVDRVGNDYPRMVALSHPALRPERSASKVRQYSQRYMDVLDLEDNIFKTVPVAEALDMDYFGLVPTVSLDQGDYLKPLTSLPLTLDPNEMVVTFEQLLAHEQFPGLMRHVLDILEKAYERPVDIEFAGTYLATHPTPQVRISLLQCRPLSHRSDDHTCDLPTDVLEEDILFTANQQVPQGCVDQIRYVIYVDPRAYAHIPEPHTRIEIGQVIGRLNQMLSGERFILVGPGRWGTSNIQLGVKVTYADIYNTRILVEVAYADGGTTPEVSYGTHFFQDLVEANIYPLPLYPDDPEIIYRDDFFHAAPNLLADLLPADERLTPYVKVIDLPAATGGRTLTVVMSSEDDQAIGYLFLPEPEEGAGGER